MQMPVAVGLLVTIIFLTVLSEWFYHTFIGWKEIILDDRLFRLRVAGATFLSLVIVFASFVGAAYVYKCPSEQREGIFESLNCEEYEKIRVLTKTF